MRFLHSSYAWNAWIGADGLSPGVRRDYHKVESLQSALYFCSQHEQPPEVTNVASRFGSSK